jgi:hypothetical protein
MRGNRQDGTRIAAALPRDFRAAPLKTGLLVKAWPIAYIPGRS